MKKLILVLLMSLPAAWAADGVIEINQASVEAGDGFPYVIDQPGSYKLTGNLTAPDANTNVIEVAADSVTLDLNGFSILGANECFVSNDEFSCRASGEGEGVSFAGGFGFHGDDVVIRNGAIRGMGSHGISGGNFLVKNIAASHNGGRGISVRSADSCSAAFNGSHGIFVIGTAINNTSRENGGSGILGSGLVQGNWLEKNIEPDITVFSGMVLDNVVGLARADVSMVLTGPNGTPVAAYARNRVSRAVEGGTAIGCNLIAFQLVCPETNGASQ